jgi:hypothetical protein
VQINATGRRSAPVTDVACAVRLIDCDPAWGSERRQTFASHGKRLAATGDFITWKFRA